MSTLRHELRAAIERRDAARVTLETLVRIALETAERAKSAESAVESARSAIREAAGAHAMGTGPESAVATARKSHRAAVEAREIAMAESEGVAERVPVLEADLAEHESRVAGIATRLCVSLAGDIEAEALGVAGQLGALLARRTRLAQFAFTQSPDDDPLGAGNHSSAFRREVLRRLGEPVAGEAIQPLNAPAVTLASLLTTTVVLDGPEAQAAE